MSGEAAEQSSGAWGGYVGRFFLRLVSMCRAPLSVSGFEPNYKPGMNNTTNFLSVAFDMGAFNSGIRTRVLYESLGDKGSGLQRLRVRAKSRVPYSFTNTTRGTL